MTVSLVLSNVASYWLQVMVLVAAGAALARVFRIDEPRAMLAYWRTLLLACLVLPLCQPWNTVVPPALESTTIVMSGTAEAPAGALVSAASRSVAWRLADLALIGLATGIAVRALWLTIGAYGLRRLRREASPLEPLPESVRHAQERIPTRAGMFVSDRISGPITFGLRRPIIVFPPSVSAMPAHVQEAIACHELIHVQRRDWLDEILEEGVRSVLWFHPAVWWLIARIRLAREQVVDQAAIRLTNSRERYVEALLAVARASSPAALTPASAFLRRHLLKKRVARILQETTMTTRRLIASLTASAAALALAATFAVRSFPLEAQGQPAAETGAPIQVVKGGEHLLHGGLPEYPKRAAVQKVEGDVVVEMTLDDRGEVSDARVLSGPEELRKAALEAVLQWHYSPSAIHSTATQATLRFRLPPVDANFEAELRERAPVLEQIKEAIRVNEKIRASRKQPLQFDAELVHKGLELESDALKSYTLTLVKPEEPVEVKPDVVLVEHKFEGTWRLAGVKADGVPEATVEEVLAQAGVAVGDVITEDMEKRIQKIARDMDDHFVVEFRGNEDTGRLSITIRAK